MFPQTTISYVKDFNCHIGAIICFWFFGVSGSDIVHVTLRFPTKIGHKAWRVFSCVASTPYFSFLVYLALPVRVPCLETCSGVGWSNARTPRSRMIPRMFCSHGRRSRLTAASDCPDRGHVQPREHLAHLERRYRRSTVRCGAKRWPGRWGAKKGRRKPRAPSPHVVVFSPQKQQE